MPDTATPRSSRPSLRRSSPPVAAAGPAPGPDLLLPRQRPSGPRWSRPGFLLPRPPEIHSGNTSLSLSLCLLASLARSISRSPSPRRGELGRARRWIPRPRLAVAGLAMNCLMSARAQLVWIRLVPPPSMSSRVCGYRLVLTDCAPRVVWERWNCSRFMLLPLSVRVSVLVLV